MGAKLRLVVGGYAQGKLDYVLSKYNINKEFVCDGVLPEYKPNLKGGVIINHFHLWVRNCLLNNGNPNKEILSFLDCFEDVIIISDEVGNGIVPIEPFERRYRECVGEILILLAERAEEVERVICGIGQKIK